MTDRPDWLHPLGTPPPLDNALGSLAATMAQAQVPNRLCHQCFDGAHGPALIATLSAIKGGARPDPADYSQILAEHPNCVGGPDAYRLTLVPALRDIWLHANTDTAWWDTCLVEKLLMAGLWCWPEAQQAALRAVAARVVLDWITTGTCALWPHDSPAERIHISDDILELALATLIDPEDLVAAAFAQETAHALDIILLAEGIPLAAPGYVADDATPGLHDAQPYRAAYGEMANIIQARMAQAALTHLTPGWCHQAIAKWDDADAEMANDLRALASGLSDGTSRFYALAQGPATGPKPSVLFAP